MGVAPELVVSPAPCHSLGQPWMTFLTSSSSWTGGKELLASPCLILASKLLSLSGPQCCHL